jgi:hypothetical protein
MKTGNIGADAVEAFLSFQPTLATAMYNLENVQRAIAERRRLLIRGKSRFSRKWFTAQMRSLGECSQVLSRMAGIGRTIGDAFAWFFYARSQHMIRRHLAHPPSKSMPAGVGGKGELEFIRQARPPGHLLLYHGITSFLRVGDVSFIDVNTWEVVALGELKSERTGPRTVRVTLHMLVNQGVAVPFAPACVDTSVAPRTQSPQPKLRDSMRRRLDRQIKNMSSALKRYKIDSDAEVRDAYHFGELQTLSASIARRRQGYVQVGPGLLIAAVRPRVSPSVSGRLFSHVSAATVVGRLGQLVSHVRSILEGGAKEDNYLLVRSLDLTATLGGVPLFWWPVDLNFIERVYFQEVVVVTVYNPAHIIARVRALGFGVEVVNEPHAVDYRLRKQTGTSGCIEVPSFQYLLRLVQDHLMKEEKVVQMLVSLVAAAQEGRLPDSAVVDISIAHHLM